MDQSSGQLLKKTLQFLVSVSLLSFLVSSYSSGLCHLFRDFNFHLTLLFPSFSQTLEKKYMFLICNGIVAFLVKSLSFTSYSAPTGSDISDKFTKTDEDGVKPLYEAEERLEHNKGAVESTIGTLENVTCIEEEQVEQENGLMYKEVQAQESRALVVIETEDDEEVEESRGGSLIAPSSAEEELGNEMNESTEELNRKFDEFIRKMKEEIRIEARRQLITV